MQATNAKAETIFAIWHCQMNSWRWPEDWGEPPKWFNENAGDDGRLCSHKYRNDPGLKQRWSSIMGTLTLVTNAKELSRVWNVIHQKHMTESEWEEWWIENGDGED